MRYPFDNKEKWYNAQRFGSKTTYGYHEGDDWNLKSGGDSDLGQPLYAVADGRIVYYHNDSHPNSKFGRHMVLEVDTPVGKRWFMYSHCAKITAKVASVKEGQKIGEVGKSGTPYAHLHFSCFKVDPKNLRDGIDTIARNSEELFKWWEDPTAFIEKYLKSPENPPASPPEPFDPEKDIPAWVEAKAGLKTIVGYNKQGNFWDFAELAKGKDREIAELQEQLGQSREQSTAEISKLNATLRAINELVEEFPGDNTFDKTGRLIDSYVSAISLLNEYQNPNSDPAAPKVQTIRYVEAEESREEPKKKTGFFSNLLKWFSGFLGK